MASFFRRKRSLILKLILGIPALWFLIVIFLSFQSTDSDKPPHEKGPDIAKRDVGNRDSGGGVFQGFQNPIDKFNQIVQPFNPFNNAKEVTKRKNVIDDNKQDSLVAGKGNPEDRIIHKDYDASSKYRTSDTGPGEFDLCCNLESNAFSTNQIFRARSQGFQGILTLSTGADIRPHSQ